MSDPEPKKDVEVELWKVYADLECGPDLETTDRKLKTLELVLKSRIATGKVKTDAADDGDGDMVRRARKGVKA